MGVWRRFYLDWSVVVRFSFPDKEMLKLTCCVVVSSSGPSMTTFLFIAVAVQIMVTGAYILYKKRRGGAPKKYL
jgi:hypothetical protein